MSVTLWQELKTTNRLFIPILLAMLIESGMLMVDTLMLGRLTPVALAAGAIGGFIFDTFIVFGLGITSAVGIFISNALGANDQRLAQQINQQGVWLCLLIGLPSVVMMLSTAPLLEWFQQNPAVITASHLYLSGLAPGYISALIFFCLRDYLTAAEKVNIVTAIIVVAFPLNAALDYILMLGKFGAPNLGVFGIGLATTLVSFFMLATLLVYLRWHKQLKQYFIVNKALFTNISFEMLGKLLRLGWPVGIARLFEVGMFLAISLMAGWVGVLPLAANQITLQCSIVVFMVPLSLSIVVSMRVALHYGANNLPAAKQSLRAALLIGLCASFITMPIFYFFPTALASLFLSHANQVAHPKLLTFAASFLQIAACYQFVDTLQIIMISALRGLHDTKVPMLITFVAYWIIGIGCAYVFCFKLHWQVAGLWWGLVVGLAAASVGLSLRYVYLLKTFQLKQCN